MPARQEAPLWGLGVAKAGAAILAGDLSPVDLVEAHLARIAEVDGAIHSYVHVAQEAARADAADAAREIGAGRWRGPLHGIPFAVKDNYDVASMPASAGSRARLGRVASQDAALVRRLRAAGAIVLGKLTTWEYGTGNGGEYFDLPFPPARNPWDVTRFTGGSSTGSGAAVAAGTAPFALGSDTTGSVRLPAAANGIVGLIPTPGLLPLDGILPNCFSLDVPGPLTWTVEDCAIVMDALSGASGREGPSLRRALATSLGGVRIAVLREPGAGFPAPAAPLAAAFEAGIETLRTLGASLYEVRLPVSAAECFAVTRLIGPAESAAIHERELRECPDDLGAALREKLLAGSAVRAVDYINALRRRTAIAESVSALIGDYDVLVTFGALHLPPRLGVEPEMTRYTVETMLTPFNLAAHPALVQCNGFTTEGLPTHWQIVANRHDEAGLIRVASAYERATRWRERRASVERAPRPEAPPRREAPRQRTAPASARALAARMGLGRLGDADAARLEELVSSSAEAGRDLPRPADKSMAPAFGLQRPHGDRPRGGKA